MAMELQIISPKPEQRFPAIKWNYEQLKEEIAAAMKDYQNLVVTPESEKEFKETKAKLNKLRTAIETARKDMKKKVNEPLVLFEKQVKEVEEPIDTAIANLDTQLREIADAKKEQKRKDIEVIWNGIANKPSYFTLERVWNEKWLNATYQMKQITIDMQNALKENEKNIETLSKLPEYAYEAVHYYTHTFDVNAAIQKAAEHAEMERQKKLEEQKKQEQATSPEQPVKNLQEIPQNGVKEPVKAENTEVSKQYNFRFEVTLTAGQAKALGDFCRTHGIKLMQIK
jgi:hypothetical protein